MATPTPSALKAGFKTENTLGAVPSMTGTVKQHFHVTDDTKVQVEAAGYFNPVAEYIGDGDLIIVSGDRDGTKWHSSYVVSKPGSGDLTLTEAAAVTSNPNSLLTVRVPVLGTASTHYVAVPFAGAITEVVGVSNANGAASTGTVTVSVPGTGEIASLAFPSGYTAGTAVEDSTITAHTLTANAVITVATDGGGDGAGEVVVTLQVTPS